MKKLNILFGTAGLSLMLVSCIKITDDNPGADDGAVTGLNKYVIAASPVGTVGEAANYLLTADDLTKGTTTTTGNGVEQDGYRYYVFHQNKVFSLLYGQGNPGAVTTYKVNSSGALSLVANMQTETVQVFGTVNNEILLIKVPRSGDANASMFRVDADNPKILGSKQISLTQLAGNGERAHFTGAFQVDDKVYAPYYCIKGAQPAVFGTAYTDSTWVAVFSYPDLKLEKVIKDNRTSYIGYYFAQNGLKQIENGDVYAFSSAVVTGAGVKPSTKPSAIVRIKKGTTEFDKSYFFNVQEKSGGHHLYSETYFGNGKFLLTMYKDPNTTAGNLRFAIVDIFAQSFTWVTGTPDVMKLISRNADVSDDGKTISVGITVDEGTFIFSIDAATARATRGMEVKAGSITAVGRLKY